MLIILTTILTTILSIWRDPFETLSEREKFPYLKILIFWYCNTAGVLRLFGESVFVTSPHNTLVPTPTYISFSILTSKTVDDDLYLSFWIFLFIFQSSFLWHPNTSAFHTSCFIFGFVFFKKIQHANLEAILTFLCFSLNHLWKIYENVGCWGQIFVNQFMETKCWQIAAQSSLSR